MKTTNKHFLIFILILLSLNLSAQQTVKVQMADNVKLVADEFRGNIQWQLSTDNESWSDIDLATMSPFMIEIAVLPSFFRAKILEDGCSPHYSETITVASDESFRWSETSTWGEAGKPVSGQEVTIPAGITILLDENPPALGGIIIEEGASLEFDRQDLNLTSEWIIVNGSLQIGTEANPFKQKAIITLNDTNTEADEMGMGTRGIMVMNGTLELHGATPNVIWTKINSHAEQESTTLNLLETVDWQSGDEIVIAPTDYFEAGNGISVTQRTAVVNVNGNQITIADGLNAFRWGLLQYPTEAGMSLIQEAIDPPVPDTETTSTPLVLDQRAEVGNMTRNIVIQSPDDDLWNNEGFGVHTMIMPQATAHVEGVEFKRGGQRGRLRRYPFHWHMLSYAGTETLADATGQYFRKNTINSSANRGVVIHGTNGVLVQDNIIYDVSGHGIFTEDAVERRNVIDGNLVLHIRNQVGSGVLKQHETGTFGASAFWISNPDNTVTNNIAADSQTFGFWLTYPANPWGINQSVLHTDGEVLRPNRLEFGVFDNNTTHSNKNDGVHLDDVEIDNEGNTGPLQYVSTTSGRDLGTSEDEFLYLTRFSLSRTKTWKNMDNGSWDRGVATDMFEVVSADNCGRFFAGSGAEGVIERSLVVGTSLNFMMNGTGRPATADFQFYPSATPTAFATYHSAFSMRDNIVVDFHVTEYDRSGVFATDDYYLRPVDKGQVRNFNNLLLNADPGVKLLSQYNYYTLASALWDPYGYWGPEENYFVYDDPFLTYGKEVTVNELGTDVVGGVSVPGPFYGFYGFVLHGVGWTPPESQPFLDVMEINIRRLDASLNEVATWNVARADPSWTLQHMRDFATTPEGIYELTFPDEPTLPTNFNMYVENMLELEETQVIGVQFDGSITNTVVLLQHRQNLANYVVYSEVGSLDDVINSTNGEVWWQDNSNNMVWVKLRGGRWEPPSGNIDDEPFEEWVNERMVLKIRETED